MAPRAFITGISGTTVTAADRAFLAESEPWGLILFARNVETPAQVKRLTASFRDAVGRDAPVLVDQEGGRVQRLGPPHWSAYPASAAYGRLFDSDCAMGTKAASLGARLIAADLLAVGIDVDCMPIADVPVDDADPVIGDRAYGETAEKVGQIARAVADGLLAGGVLPVVKHIPGHGRAKSDSHHGLPVVETDRDTLERTAFAAFRPRSALPRGMTAPVVHTAIDALAPATTSATLVADVIRGWLGFGGLLMSDDISMGALSGSVAELARAAIAAGCDIVLHCNGALDEMRALAEVVPVLARESAGRADAALAKRGRAVGDDLPSLRAQWTAIMGALACARRATS